MWSSQHFYSPCLFQISHFLQLRQTQNNTQLAKKQLQNVTWAWARGYQTWMATWAVKLTVIKLQNLFLNISSASVNRKKPRYLTSRDNFWCHASCNKRWECKEVVSRQNRNFWKELRYQGYYIISSKILILNLVIQTRN